MTHDDHELEARNLDARSHLISAFPVVALVAALCWVALARPSAQAAPSSPPAEPSFAGESR